MRKKHQIVLIDSEKPSFIFKLDGKLCWGKNTTGFGRESKHLYILSDEGIKEGDWYININTKDVLKCSHDKEMMLSSNKKIVATTNSELQKFTLIERADDGRGIGGLYEALPKLPTDFIERYVKEYNRGNVIEEVMLEYYDEDCPISKWNSIKTRPNNTIIIHPSKTYTGEEMIKYCMQMLDEEGIKFHYVREWFDKNLK